MKTFIMLSFAILLLNRLIFAEITISKTDENCMYSSAFVSGDTINVYPVEGDLWFGFRLDGVFGKKATINIKGIRTVSIPDPKSSFNNSHWYDRNRPGITYDHKTWEIPDNGYAFPCTTNCGNFTFTHAFSKSPAWIYYAYTVTNKMLSDWITEREASPYLAKKQLCLTPGLPSGGPNGQCTPNPLWMLTITEPAIADSIKKVFWIIAREDAWETAGTIGAQGMVEFLLSNDSLAIAARNGAIWKIIPLVSVDAVSGGFNSGLSKTGEDIYIAKTWGTGTCVTIDAIENEIKSWVNTGKRFDYGLYLHSFMWMWIYTNPFIKDARDSLLGNSIVTEMKKISPKCVAPSIQLDPYNSDTTPYFFSGWVHYDQKIPAPMMYIEFSMTRTTYTPTQSIQQIKDIGAAAVRGIRKYYNLNNYSLITETKPEITIQTQRTIWGKKTAIRLFSLSGKQVKYISGGSEIERFFRNIYYGNLDASAEQGLYMYRIVNPSGLIKTGKVVIICQGHIRQ